MSLKFYFKDDIDMEMVNWIILERFPDGLSVHWHSSFNEKFPIEGEGLVEWYRWGGTMTTTIKSNLLYDDDRNVVGIEMGDAIGLPMIMTLFRITNRSRGAWVEDAPVDEWLSCRAINDKCEQLLLEMASEEKNLTDCLNLSRTGFMERYGFEFLPGDVVPSGLSESRLSDSNGTRPNSQLKFDTILKVRFRNPLIRTVTMGATNINMRTATRDVSQMLTGAQL